MKKLSMAFAVALVLTGVSYAASNTVENILGYTKITIPSNQLVLVALDFNNESNTINGLFGNLPTGSSVYIWDATAQRYNVIARLRTGWGTPGTNRIEKGTGAFITLPRGGVQTNVLLSGIVPMAGTTTVYKANGYSLISYPYPVAMSFTNTALAKTAAVGDQVSIWQNNAWTVYTKIRTGWGSATNLTLKPGQAFFFKGTGSGSAKEIRPYSAN